MDWLYSFPEPFRTIIAVILALAGLLVMLSPIFILVFGVSQILMSDVHKENKDN